MDTVNWTSIYRYRRYWPAQVVRISRRLAPTVFWNSCWNAGYNHDTQTPYTLTGLWQDSNMWFKIGSCDLVSCNMIVVSYYATLYLATGFTYHVRSQCGFTSNVASLDLLLFRGPMAPSLCSFVPSTIDQQKDALEPNIQQKDTVVDVHNKSCNINIRP